MPRVLAGRKCKTCGGVWSTGHQCDKVMLFLAELRTEFDKYADKLKTIQTMFKSSTVISDEKIRMLAVERLCVENFMTSIIKLATKYMVTKAGEPGYDLDRIRSLIPKMPQVEPMATLMQANMTVRQQQHVNPPF